jgi:hypothetical protein
LVARVPRVDCPTHGVKSATKLAPMKKLARSLKARMANIELLCTWNYQWSRRGNQQQDQVNQTSRKWRSQYRKLQKSDLLLLWRTRSLPTVIPDGPFCQHALCTTI